MHYELKKCGVWIIASERQKRIAQGSALVALPERSFYAAAI